MNELTVVDAVARLVLQSQMLARQGSAASADQARAQIAQVLADAHQAGNLPDPEGMPTDVVRHVIRHYSSYLPVLLGTDPLPEKKNDYNRQKR